MVFIDPIKHASTFKRFSKHDNVMVSPDNRFCLQKRKKQVEGNNNNYRIILLGNPYYIIAYSNDLNSLKEREWRYLVEEIPRRIPEGKAEKDLLPWFLAHFTCLTMELGEKYQPEPDSDDENTSTIASGSSLLTPHHSQGKDSHGKDIFSSHHHTHHGNQTTPTGTNASLASIPSSTGIMHSEPIALDRPYFAHNSPAGRVGAGFTPPPQSRHDNSEGKLYPASTFPLRGITPLLITIVVFNLPMLLVRELKDEASFSLLMTFCNILIFSIVLLGFPYTIGISRMVPGSYFTQNKDQKKNIPNSSSDGTSSDPNASNASVQGGNQDVEGNNDNGDDDGLVKPGGPTKCSSRGITPAHTLQQSEPGQTTPNTYSDPQGESWTLRCGPDYKSQGKKAPGGPSMFDLVGLDVFMSKSKIKHVARHINFEPLYSLPKTPYVNLEAAIDLHYQKVIKEQQENPLEYVTAQSIRTKHEITNNIQLPPSQIYDPQFDPSGKIQPKGELLPGFHFGSIEKPFLFFVTMQIPTYAPSYLGGVTDGEGMNLVWYCRATPETQRDLLRPDPVSPAVRLLKKHLLGNPIDPDYLSNMDRFKNIPRLVNTEEFDFGWSVDKLVKKYNAKPFLTRPQGILHRGPGYANFDLDIHQFCYMAKNVLNTFIPMMSRVILDWTFCVEGTPDDELPEASIAQFRVFKIQAQSFPSWEETVKELEKAKSDPNYDSNHNTGLVPLQTTTTTNGAVPPMTPASPTGQDKKKK